MRLQEGKQYFIHRIEFTGNTTTRDRVIRREMALLEGGVFNVEALKYTVKRLNQLGYFKPLEGTKDVKVDKTPGADNTVDVTLKLEEQNRNQLNFGAGMSQYDGFFGTFSYTAANFLGRGEGVTVALQRGSRSNLYQFSINEPYLFDQPMSASFDLYSRKNNYYTAVNKVGYSEVREGATLSMGRPLRRFMHGYFGYTYEVIHISISDDLLKATSGASLYGLPSFNLGLDSGRHVDSRVMPALSYNTVDQPIFPRSGMRADAQRVRRERAAGRQLQLREARGGGGRLRAHRPPHCPSACGGRAGGCGCTAPRTTLPYYLRYFLGGETQIRGVDIRIGRADRPVQPVPRRQQVHALQRGARLRHHEPGAVPALPRRRAGVLGNPAPGPHADAHVDRRRVARHGADAERAVPADLRARTCTGTPIQPKWAFKFAVGTTF